MESLITYRFSAEKNHKLIKERSISFEEVIAAIEEGWLLDIVEHPNAKLYPNQKMYIVQIENYIYLVPFVEEGNDSVFLKTIIPSRKATKLYLTGGKNL
jgi:hypothetical protein